MTAGGHCFACGILPKFAPLRMVTPAEAWQCPPVIPRAQRQKAAQEPVAR